jgi:bacillithiol biosynthesis cysteine-adding enzyme BshC
MPVRYSFITINFAAMKFSSSTIPFAGTHQFPKLFLDYVSRDEKLMEGNMFFADDNGFAQAVEYLNYIEEIRPVVTTVIREQYLSTGISIDEKLISKLEQAGTMTVCTGHQLCLFTGPLYFIYKIISTIRLAEEQSAKTGKQIVPVYWMASEDHDFEEICSVNLFGKTLKWNEKAKGPVGKLKTDSLGTILGELKILVGENEVAKKLYSIIEKAYRAGRTLAQATRELVHELFSGKVLMLDGDDARLKKFFVPVFKNDLIEHMPEKSVSLAISKLSEAGYEIQVNPRNINVFFMKENLRERIEERDGKYVVLNSTISFSKEELLEELKSHPEHFSPNVVLRPLYQQLILPNLAYVGGPGEISYWLEYPGLFNKFGITFPILQPRHFALIIDKNSGERLSKLQIEISELFADVEEVVKSFVKKNLGDSISIESEKEELKKIFENIRKKISAFDSSLEGAANAELQKQLNGIENLESKVLKAAKQKQEVATTQIRKIRDKILPGNVLQERHENFIPLYLKYGEEFIPELSAAFGFPVEGLLILGEK